MNHMDHPEMPGVYQIVHLKSGKRYVGSSIDLRERCRAHGFDLRGNRHFCAHLQNAWNKYGEEAFEFRVIETCLAEKTILFAREQHWIDKNIKRLYNTRPVAEILSPEYFDCLPEREIVCKYCGKQFKNKSNKPKVEYCSRPCVVKGRRKEGLANEVRVCKYCGSDFVIEKYFRHVHCSPLCGARSRSNVTPEKVVAVCQELVDGNPIKEIAERHGLTEGVVNHLGRRKTWKEVVLPPDLDAAIKVLWSEESKKRRILVAMRRRCKLTVEQAMEIKIKLASGMTVVQICDAMNLDYNQVYPVKTGATFSDITI